MHAVVSALELQNLVALTVGAGSAKGVEGCLGAAAGETNLVRAGDGVNNLLRKLNGLIVVGEEGRAFLNLLADDFGHLRMGMPNEHGTGAEQEVNILVAAGVAYPACLTFCDNDIPADVAETSTGQDAVCPLDQFRFRCGDSALCHLPAPCLTMGMWVQREPNARIAEPERAGI